MKSGHCNDQVESVGLIQDLRCKTWQPAEGAVVSNTIGNESRDFASIRHVLSDKPVHRRGDKYTPRES